MVNILLPDNYGMNHLDLDDGSSSFTKLEIIDFILSIYTENPKNRAKEFGIIPRIKTSDGRCDPLGIALEEPDLYQRAMGISVYKMINIYRTKYMNQFCHVAFGPEGVFKRWFRGHELKFWQELQEFHDDDSYFTDVGISLSGSVQRLQLKSKWASNNKPKNSD